MKLSTATISLITAFALTAAPLASASAHDWDHHGGGRWGHGGGYWEHGGGWGHEGHHDHDGWGLFGFGAAVVGAAAAVATAPFYFADDVVAGPAPAPYYAPPAYYYPHHVVYAAPAPAYAYPAPYYGVPAGYYAGY